MTDKIIIIGKRSNLSKELKGSFSDSLVIGSDDIESLEIELRSNQKISAQRCYNKSFFDFGGRTNTCLSKLD